MMQVYTYGVSNVYSEKAEDFSHEAVDAKMTGGEVDFEEEVILNKSFIDNNCLYGVYTAMGKATKFKEYLQNFDNNFTNPVANLRLTTGVHPVYPNATAVTDEPNNYLIKITFNPNLLNRPNIDVARTMIHEMIHAEMYRKLLSIARQPEVPWTEAFIKSLKNDFEGLEEYYTRYWLEWPLDQPAGAPQHQLMAEHYIEIIKQTLRDYDDSLTDLQYEALAWVGLKGGAELNAITGLPPNPTVAWEKEPLANRLLLNSAYENFIASNPNCQ
ncbi:hypothetical protein ACKGJN_16165 [Gillisia sp. Q332]|uniref:hypothetical protein n=1 Tax=Gillisia xinjiangensis TaxID=3384765 RepID=UPI00391B1E1D